MGAILSILSENSKISLKILCEVRIANALDRLAPPEKKINNLDKSEGFVYESKSGLVRPVLEINRIPIGLLQGIVSQKKILLDNTISFANNLSANNALLWGARGTGKSSLVKAVHAEVILKTKSEQLKLVEIHREDIAELPELLSLLSNYKKYKFILLCDDLSFDAGENTYKSLKAALDGGIEGKPNNVIFYATSNRRHLMPRDMMENEQSTAINPSESVEGVLLRRRDREGLDHEGERHPRGLEQLAGVRYRAHRRSHVPVKRIKS